MSDEVLDATPENRANAVIPYKGPTSDYQFLYDAYYGTNGFKDGSYLVAHPRETPEKFARRKAMAYFSNYVKVVINAHVDPVFRKEPTRVYEENATLFSAFMENADGAGTAFSKFIKRAGRMAKLYTVCFIVVDNFAEGEQPLSLLEAKEGRKFPYCYIVKPQDVVEYEVDRNGNIKRFSYDTKTEKFTCGNKVSEMTRWTWTPEECTRSVVGNSTEAGGVDVVVTPNALGVVPVVPYFGQPTEPGELMPEKEFYNIVQTNHAIFNICSELRELLRNQAFAVLTYPMGEGDDPDAVQEMIIGTETVLAYDGTTSKAPAFIAPPAEQAALLQAELSRLVEEIYRMAGVKSMIGVQASESGVAKAYNFEETNKLLADFSQNTEVAEKAIAVLFEKYTGEKLKYTATYPEDFGIVDIASELDNVTKALNLAIGGLFDTAIKKKAVAITCSDLDDKTYDAIVKDVEAQGEKSVEMDEYNRQWEIAQGEAAAKAAKSGDVTGGAGGNA